jgi:hypothetical protein
MSSCMCKTYLTMTGFMFCMCDYRTEHMVKIPTVFSITLSHDLCLWLLLRRSLGTRTFYPFPPPSPSLSMSMGALHYGSHYHVSPPTFPVWEGVDG